MDVPRQLPGHEIALQGIYTIPSSVSLGTILLVSHLVTCAAYLGSSELAECVYNYEVVSSDISSILDRYLPM